jgi:hypothetical protein
MKAKESGSFDTMAQQASALIDFNLADANPVSIITQRVSAHIRLVNAGGGADSSSVPGRSTSASSCCGLRRSATC